MSDLVQRLRDSADWVRKTGYNTHSDAAILNSVVEAADTIKQLTREIDQLVSERDLRLVPEIDRLRAALERIADLEKAAHGAWVSRSEKEAREALADK